MRKFNIKAFTPSGDFIFASLADFVPRKDEEIQIKGHIFVVKNVRYVLEEGTTNTTDVVLLLVKR